MSHFMVYDGYDNEVHFYDSYFDALQKLTSINEEDIADGRGPNNYLTLIINPSGSTENWRPE